MHKEWKIAVLVGSVIFISSLTMGGYESSKDSKAQSKEDLYNQIELFSDAIKVLEISTHTWRPFHNANSLSIR